MEPHPRWNADGPFRDSYDGRMLRNVGQFSLSSNLDRSPSRQPDRRGPPPFQHSVTAPAEGHHRASTPQQSSDPYAFSTRRNFEAPPPRASRHQVGGYQETFGDLPGPTPGSNTRLQYNAYGPPRDPFTPRQQVAADRPYGGGPAPRNPYGPGGSIYDTQRATGLRFDAERTAPSDFENYQESRRYNHYRGNVGESWGVNEFQRYQDRRDHEQRMRRGDRRDGSR